MISPWIIQNRVDGRFYDGLAWTDDRTAARTFPLAGEAHHKARELQGNTWEVDFRVVKQ